jgi:hypothetical protein
LLDFVAARKERGIAAHRIKQQTFVRLRTRFSERGSVMKIHLHRLDAKACARHLGMDSQRDSLVRLNPNNKHI